MPKLKFVVSTVFEIIGRGWLPPPSFVEGVGTKYQEELKLPMYSLIFIWYLRSESIIFLHEIFVVHVLTATNSSLKHCLMHFVLFVTTIWRPSLRRRNGTALSADVLKRTLPFELMIICGNIMRVEFLDYDVGH